MSEKRYYYWRGGDLYLNLYTAPRAKSDRVVGVHGSRLKIQIAAPANDGKANARLIKFLANKLAVPSSSISIIQGEHAPYKLVKIVQPPQDLVL